LGVHAHQLDPTVRDLLDDAGIFLARLGFHRRRAVTGRDRARWREHRLDDFAPPEFIADRKRVGPRLAALAIDSVTAGTTGPLFSEEKRFAAHRVPFSNQGRVAVVIFDWRRPGGRNREQRNDDNETRRANRRKRSSLDSAVSHRGLYH